MKTSLLTTIALLTSTVCAVDSALSLRHRESEGVGYSQGYSTLDYTLTTQRNKTEFLFNLRGHLFNNGKAAGNTGLGVRYSLNHDNSRIGMNVFYDFRDYSHFFAQQVAGGLEWISRAVDVRLNGYLPIGKQRSFQEHRFQNFSGNHVLTRRKFSTALPCAEGEIGTALARPFYFAAGTYYLFRESSHSIRVGKAWGWKARFDVDLGQYFSLGAIATHDSIFKTRVQGYLSLHIPLGPWKSTADRSRDLRRVPIVRNEIIPIQVRKDSQTPFVSSNQKSLNFLFVNNQAYALGDGTFEHPFSSLKEAENHSKPGDVIYVYPGDGTPRGMHEGIVLKERQILASSGSSLELDSLTIPPQTPHVNPAITNIHSGKPVVTNPGESDLNSFYMMDPWEYLKNYDFQAYSINNSANSNSAWDDPALEGWVDLRASPLSKSPTDKSNNN